MSRHAIYRQLNKDHAYWTEKRLVGHHEGGQMSGLLSFVDDGVVIQNILFDCGLGTLRGLADFCEDAFWDQPLSIFITHGHADHHLELMILAEIYCQRRGKTIDDFRPPLPVYCTEDTYPHLFNTHRYGYTGGNTLYHAPIQAGTALAFPPFSILPLNVNHFPGAVIYVISFGVDPAHKILIGWDMTDLPLAETEIGVLRNPSLALLEATTWTSMVAETGHTSVEDLVGSGFLAQLELEHAPEKQRYGAYLVHYSGREDPGGLLSDEALAARFGETFPEFAPVVRVAQRGQTWLFDL